MDAKQFGFAVAVVALTAFPPASARADDATGGGNGARIFKAANCVACHKWSGIGGGGYGGAAANLRKTQLSPDEIKETIRCGHSGGGMPYFQQDVYKSDSCNGMKASDMDVKSMPAAAEHFLEPPEIADVAQYVVDHFKGKGDPTYEECVGFFGHETHLCDEYPKSGAAGGHDAPTGRHLVIETAPDANAVTK
jgi:mono/diheme cytochrome c family protein